MLRWRIYSIGLLLCVAPAWGDVAIVDLTDFHLTPEQQQSEIGHYCPYDALSAASKVAHLHLSADLMTNAWDPETQADPKTLAKIYTPERIKKAQAIFQQVQDLAGQVLQQKLKSLPPPNPYANDLMLSLSRSRLAVGLPSADRLPLMYQFNAMTFSDQQILIGTLILLVDDQPEALFHVLAHEMGHIVGPSFLFSPSTAYNHAPIFPAYDARYPFDQSLKCVSPYDQKFDADCFEAKVEDLSQYAMLSSLAKDVQTTQNELEANPYINVLLYKSGRIGCQVGQFEESQADFFGAEVMSFHLQKMSPLEAQQGLQNSLAFFCEQIWRENLNPQSPVSQYPDMVTRISDLILRNSDLRKVLGEDQNAQKSCAF